MMDGKRPLATPWTAARLAEAPVPYPDPFAMAAEEAKDPTRTIPRAYIGGILTLVVLAFGACVLCWTVVMRFAASPRADRSGSCDGG